MSNRDTRGAVLEAAFNIAGMNENDYDDDGTTFNHQVWFDSLRGEDDAKLEIKQEIAKLYADHVDDEDDIEIEYIEIHEIDGFEGWDHDVIIEMDLDELLNAHESIGDHDEETCAIVYDNTGDAANVGYEIENGFRGIYESIQEYGQQLFEDLNQGTEENFLDIKPYVNWGQYGEDNCSWHARHSNGIAVFTD